VLAGEIPVVPVASHEVADGLPLVEALARTPLAASKGEARRGLAGRGFAVNGDKTDETDRVLGPPDLLADRWVLLKKGKKHYTLLDVR